MTVGIKGLRYIKMFMTGLLQDKEDWKGFASYEGLSKLFKVHQWWDLEIIYLVKLTRSDLNCFKDWLKWMSGKVYWVLSGYWNIKSS